MGFQKNIKTVNLGKQNSSYGCSKINVHMYNDIVIAI